MRLLLLLLFASFICAPSAFAQLEVGNAGTVSIGSAVTPLSNRGLNTSIVGDSTVVIPGEYLYGLYTIATNGDEGSYGVYAESKGPNTQKSVGVRSEATGGTIFNMGVFSDVTGVAGAYSYGLYGNTDNQGTESYGVYARSTGGTGNSYGIYASGVTMAGYFSGDITVTGTVHELSDGRLKEEVAELGEQGIRAKLMQLSPKRYRMRHDAVRAGLRLNDREEYGLIAQELEAVVPELVSEIAVPADFDPETGEELAPAAAYKGVNYQGLIPLLLQVVQEQDAELARLRQALEKAGIAVEEE